MKSRHDQHHRDRWSNVRFLRRLAIMLFGDPIRVIYKSPSVGFSYPYGKDQTNG